MTLERFCADQGLLVDGVTRLAADPCEYYDKAVRALVGCSQLRCVSCGAWVRGGAPGLTLKENAVVDTALLYAAPSWVDLPFVERRKPALRNETAARLYACKCLRWEATRVDCIENDHDSPNDPELPWRCAGHHPPTLPVTLGDLTITETSECASLVSAILDGWCPRPLEIAHGNGDGPSVWLGWMYAYLKGLPLAEELSSAIADRIDDRDPLVVGRVLFFFARFASASGIERLIARAEADPHQIAVGSPIPEYYEVPTLWDVLLARTEHHDRRSGGLVRRVLVLPLSTLSHADLGSTSLVECERQLRSRMGWDLQSDFARGWLEDYARLKKSERVDVVANDLGRSSGAFDDPDMRLFIADHIVEIDAAAPGRWRQAMNLLSDWLHKPELGHLIVVAGAHLIEAGHVSADEIRAWIVERRAYGWVDDAWVLPLEAMLDGR